MSSNAVRNGKLVMGLLLVSMILMRLVWMDLREYHVTLDPRVNHLIHKSSETFQCTLGEGSQHESPQGLGDIVNSPLYRLYLSWSCSGSELRVPSYIRMNQGLFVGVIILCVLISRFFAKSWLLCLMTAAILLSRGSLVAANGDLSGQALAMFIVTVWVTLVCHWQRSGSIFVCVGLIFISVLLSFLDRSFVFLSFGILLPYLLLYFLRKRLSLPLLRQLRDDLARSRKRLPIKRQERMSDWGALATLLRQALGWSESMEWGYRPLEERYKEGSLLRSLDVPFVLWVQHCGKWRLILTVFALVCGVQVCSLLYEILTLPYVWTWDIPLTIWWTYSLAPLDIDLEVGMLVIFISLFAKPVWGLISFREACLVFLSALFSVSLGAYLWDVTQPAWQIYGLELKLQKVLIWFEPTILTFGVIGVYHLIRVLDQFLLAKKPSASSVFLES